MNNGDMTRLDHNHENSAVVLTIASAKLPNRKRRDVIRPLPLSMTLSLENENFEQELIIPKIKWKTSHADWTVYKDAVEKFLISQNTSLLEMEKNTNYSQLVQPE
ncbi:hypothetical protein JTB14_034109 [Gonioctena quinquepunctata]|nr:hypothetical protein JTB14_034109 [Gonioctena quinquepunctata]